MEVLTASGDFAMRLAVAAPAVGNIANTGGVGAGDRTLGFERLPRVLGWYPLPRRQKPIRGSKVAAHRECRGLREHYNTFCEDSE